MIVYLVTRNKDKLAAAKNAFDESDIDLRSVTKEYIEIQAESSMQIAKFTAIQAAQDLKNPAIREDHSLFINALSGFPGPYTNYFDKYMPCETLLELMRDKKDRRGYFEIATAIAYPDGSVKEFSYRVPIKISTTVKGDRGNWDKILMLEDSDETFAESPSSNRVYIWNQNFIKIKKYLEKNTKDYKI
jgi:XTP/dITP diphosphohydrolase